MVDDKKNEGLSRHFDMKIWNSFLAQLERELGSETVAKWVRPLKILRFDAQNLYLEAQDSFQVSWFEEHIRPRLKRMLINNNQHPIRVHLFLPFQEKKEKVKEKKSSSTFLITPDSLDPECTFENFLTSQENEMAFRILSEVSYNPIFLYGPKGSGKTHLLMSAALSLQKKGQKVFFVRAETFTEHVVQAMRLGFMQEFRKIYREIDTLFIDDIHIFSKRSATQEEFFHTFNTLHTTGRQIILSSNFSPSRLKEIEPRLISRFEWGISIGIQKGDMGRILEKKAVLWQFPLSKELESYLLKAFPENPLLALQALVLRAKKEEVMTPSVAEQLLSDLFEKTHAEALTSEKIIKAVAAHYSLKSEDLLSKSQLREIALARQVAIYLCRERLKLPFQKIGELFGKDHSTIMASSEKIRKKAEKKEIDLLEIL